MAEYIEREAALKEANGFPFTMSMCLTEQECVGMQRAQAIITKRIIALPDADVRPVVRGKWVMISYDEAGCSNCGYDRFTPFESTREAKERWRDLPPFCEMCGADMREEKGNG